jgi:hypothetical protein
MDIANYDEEIERSAHPENFNRHEPDNGHGQDDMNETNSTERTEEQRQEAVKAIRAFRDDEGTIVEYVNTVTNPYRDDESLIEVYKDDQGNEYWVDTKTDRLVQMGPCSDERPRPSNINPQDKLPVAKLREIANKTIMRAMPDFMDRRSRLHPLEDNHRGQVYFFRYDDFSGPVSENELPPFIQVGVRGDGLLICFTDTMNR